MLNKYFESAVKRYRDKIPEENLISPISEGDAKVIKEIIEIFKKLNQDAVVQILKNWKYHKDSEVEESLLEVNTNIVRGVDKKGKEDEPISEEEFQERLQFIEDKIRRKIEEEIRKRPFIRFRDKDFNAWSIFSVDTGYDIQEGSERFYICINKVDESVSKIPMYANTYFWFDREETRDLEVKKLRSLLESSGTLRYIK